MQITQVFKSLICFFTIIAVLFFSPNALFSQDAKSTSKPPTSAGSSLQRALTLPPRSQEPAGTQGKTGPQAKTATAVYSDTQYPLDPVRRPSLITQAVSLTLLSLALHHHDFDFLFKNRDCTFTVKKCAWGSAGTAKPNYQRCGLHVKLVYHVPDSSFNV